MKLFHGYFIGSALELSVFSLNLTKLLDNEVCIAKQVMKKIGSLIVGYCKPIM